MSSQPLILVQFPTTDDIPNYSPFCVKAEVLLKMAGLNYSTEWLSDPRKTPKGKLPILRDGQTTVADSEFIQRYLIEQKSAKFDAHLNAREQAQAHAFTVMIDERTYWGLVSDRWIDDGNWQTTKDYFFGDMPFPLDKIIPAMARKSVRSNLHGHGIGRHSREELLVLIKKDFDALAAQLGDNDFLFGDIPCSADAAAFGFLVNLMHGQLKGDLKSTIKAYPSLITYVDRGMAHWFPEKQRQAQQ